MKRKYTIKKNRPIVKCPKCGNSKVQDTDCQHCKDYNMIRCVECGTKHLKGMDCHKCQ